MTHVHAAGTGVVLAADLIAAHGDPAAGEFLYSTLELNKDGEVTPAAWDSFVENMKVPVGIRVGVRVKLGLGLRLGLSVQGESYPAMTRFFQQHVSKMELTTSESLFLDRIWRVKAHANTS